LPAADSPGEWEVEFYADESGREPCREWMGKLTPLKRIGGLDVVETEFGKALGGGLYEFRLRWSADRVDVAAAGACPERPPAVGYVVNASRRMGRATLAVAR